MSGRSGTTHDTPALLLRRVEYGDSDLILALFTEGLGRVSALARGARRSVKRFAGALEAMHTLQVRCEELRNGELFALREARILLPRTTLSQDLERMQAAGRALSWVRRAAPPRTPEPLVWECVTRLLDGLNDRRDTRPPLLHLTTAGLGLLAAFGWALELSSCVRCAKPCPAGSPAMFDAARGGLVCRACGGARLRLTAAGRERLARAAAGVEDALTPEDGDVALSLVESSMRAHAGFE